MNTAAKPMLLLRLLTPALALTLALGLNAAAAFAMGESGTPNGHGRATVADLGTLPGVVVYACRAG